MVDDIGQRQLQEYAEASGEWLCQQIEAESVLQGKPLQDWDKWVLRRGFQEFSEEDIPHVVVSHNLAVHLVRSAIVRAKKAGKPTVKVRDGLRLPVEWQEHYQVVYTTELPWMIAVAMQNAFFGNPLAGEEKPWNSDLVVTDGVKKAVGWGSVGALIATLLGG